MPSIIISYILGIIQGYKITATYLSFHYNISHDKITRFLLTSCAYKQWYLSLVHRMFGALTGGCLIIDDTILAKPFGKNFVKASWVYSSCEDKAVFGYNVVLLAWTNGVITIPLAWRFWQKGGKSKTTLAIELLEVAKRKWRFKPDYVMFDSWYASKDILRKLQKWKWLFICQIKKNRVFDGKAIEQILTQDNKTHQGYLYDSVHVSVIKHDGKYFCTNCHIRISQIVALYKIRWKIEEIFRVLKTELKLERCQSRSQVAQEKHLLCCCIAYLLLQKEQQIQQAPSVYAVKQQLAVDRRLGRNTLRRYEKFFNFA